MEEEFEEEVEEEGLLRQGSLPVAKKKRKHHDLAKAATKDEADGEAADEFGGIGNSGKRVKTEISLRLLDGDPIRGYPVESPNEDKEVDPAYWTRITSYASVKVAIPEELLGEERDLEFFFFFFSEFERKWND